MLTTLLALPLACLMIASPVQELEAHDGPPVASSTPPALGLVVDHDVEWSGLVRAASIEIREGATVWARGDLELVSDSILVVLGDIQAVDRPGDGADLRLTAARGLVVSGALRAGDGAPAFDSGVGGGRGGDVLLEAPVVALASDVMAGRGGAGGPGGAGGSGGLVHVHGRVSVLGDGVPPVLRGGDGGAGGHGDARNPDGGRGGDGGWAGVPDGFPGVPGDDDLIAGAGATGAIGAPCGLGGLGGSGMAAMGGVGGPGGDGQDGGVFESGGDGGRGGDGGDARGQDGGTGGKGGDCCILPGTGGMGGPGGSGGLGFGGDGGPGGDGGSGFLGDGDGGDGGDGGFGQAGAGGDGSDGGAGLVGGAGGVVGPAGTGFGGDPGAPGLAGGSSGMPGQPGSPGASIPGGSGTPGSVGVAGCAPWGSVGPGKPGLFGLAPVLDGTGTLTDGSSNVVSLTLAYPSSSFSLVLGLTPLAAPFKGGVLWPQPDLIVAGLPTLPDGSFSLPFTWPVTGPGALLFAQGWVQDPVGTSGLSASNGLRLVSQ